MIVLSTTTTLCRKPVEAGGVSISPYAFPLDIIQNSANLNSSEVYFELFKHDVFDVGSLLLYVRKKNKLTRVALVEILGVPVNRVRSCETVGTGNFSKIEFDRLKPLMGDMAWVVDIFYKSLPES
jgi:hypothetical protein